MLARRALTAAPRLLAARLPAVTSVHTEANIAAKGIVIPEYQATLPTSQTQLV